MNRNGRRIALPLLLLIGMIRTAAAQAPETPAPVKAEAKGGPLVPMIFPVAGKHDPLIDTFGAPRGGGTRKHQGQDLMSPKMTPLLAVFDGIVSFSRTDTPNQHNMLTIRGENGWTAHYLHINNDTPGTDDGMGSAEYAFAPGLQSGQRVVAGQFIAYVGDSGNAEEVGPHLHFELSGPSGIVNAYASLKAAQKISEPRYAIPDPELRPARGEVRLDAVVTTVDKGRRVFAVRPMVWIGANGKTTVQTKPGQKWLKWDDKTRLHRRDDAAQILSPADLTPELLVTIVIPDDREAASLTARRIAVAPPQNPVPMVSARSRNRSNIRPVIVASVAPTVAPSADSAPREETSSSAPAPPVYKAAPPEVARRVVDLINHYRRSRGLSELVSDDRLGHAAQVHCETMAAKDIFRSIGPDGKDAAARVAVTGYKASAVAELLAGGYDTPEATVAYWQRTPELRRLLLSETLREIGVGFRYQPGDDGNVRHRHYWTVVLASP